MRRASQEEEEAMKKPHQPRLFVWAVLVRDVPEGSWRVYESWSRERFDIFFVERVFGSRNVRVKKVEVKP